MKKNAKDAKIITRKVKALQAACPPNWRETPSDVRRRRDANVRYIFGFDPDRYLHCSAGWFDLSDQPKKVAAHYQQ